MSVNFQIVGYVKGHIENSLIPKELSEDEMQSLSTRKKVEKAFNLHLVATCLCGLYSIYASLPSISSSKTTLNGIVTQRSSEIIYRFSPLYRRNTLLLTTFLGITLVLHIFLKNRQNPYVTCIQDLCKEKLQENQFTAFAFQKNDKSQNYYICSKDSQNQVTLSSLIIQGDIDKHIKTHLKDYNEISLQDLIAR